MSYSYNWLSVSKFSITCVGCGQLARIAVMRGGSGDTEDHGVVASCETCTDNGRPRTELILDIAKAVR